MESMEVMGKEVCITPLSPDIAEGNPFSLAFLVTFRVRPAKANASQLYFNSKVQELGAPLGLPDLKLSQLKGQAGDGGRSH